MPARILFLLLLLALPAYAEPAVAYYYGGRLVYPEAVQTRGGQTVLTVDGHQVVPTDEIVLRFRPGADVEGALAPYTVLSRDSLGPGTALIRVPVQDPLETLRIANRLYETLPVLYASPNFRQVLQRAEPGPPSWTRVVLDDMQGAQYTVAGNPTWGRAPGGLWCAAGGTAGRDPATQNYAAGMDATLTFGPYDLSDATWAIFRMGLTAEIASDARFTVETSTDGVQFTERLAFTSTSIPEPTLIYRGANEASPQLNVARSIGDLRGFPTVWFRFRFTSTGEGAKGVFLHGLDVRKSTTQGPLLTADPLSGQQWALRNVGQTGGFPGADLNVPEAWKLETGNPNLLVAVLDDGVQLDHPDLDVVKGLSPTGEGPPDGDAPGNEEHGTACAGIIAARRDNGLGGAGIARVRIMPIRIFTSNGAGATDEQMARGIRHAMDGGARVMSNSWSGAPNDPVAFAFRDAIAQGVVVVAATGNRQGQPVSFPARLPDVIAVASTNQCDGPKRIDDSSGDPYGSCTGPEVSVSAPGTQIVTCDLTGNRGVSTGDYTTAFNGTSSACPAVSGVVALMLSRNPSLTPAQVKAILERTAVDVEGTGGRTDLTGWGRVDAAAAVRAVPVPGEPAAAPATSAAAGGGCFVATAAYGSALDPHVGTLRGFRDRWLLTNAPGRAFVDWYYGWSPQAAERLRQHDLARAAVRFALTPVVLVLEYPLAALALLLLAVRRRRLALLLLAVVLLAGCGGSGGSTTTSTPQQSAPAAGRLAVELQLAQNRAVPGETRSVRLTLRTPGGVQVHQSTLPKAPRLEVDGLPFGDYVLTVDLLDGAGAVLGTFSRDVTLVFGGTVTVRDPAFRLSRILLQAGRLFEAGGPARAVLVHDLDGDGRAEVAAARTDGRVAVLANDGAANLQLHTTYAADAQSLAGLPRGLAAATPQGLLLLPEGRNLGYPGATHVVAGDWNADGRPDLAFQHEGQVVALLDLGGTFAEASRVAAPGPLASDGAQRIAAADEAGGVVRLLQADPAGRFRVAETLPAGSPAAVAFTPSGLAVADPAAGLVRLLPGTATFPAGAAPRAVATAGDRVVALDATGRAWTPGQSFHAGTAGALGDLDGDAVPELVTALGPDVVVFGGLATGFRAPDSLEAPDPGGLSLGSFTAPGQVELAVATRAGQLRIYRRLALQDTRAVRPGARQVQKGVFTDATFAQGAAVAGETGVSVFMHPFGVSDVPLAGRPTGLCVGSFGGFPTDLAVSQADAGTVTFLLSDSDGGFTPGGSVAVGSGPAGLAMDGRTLVVALQGQDAVATLHQVRRAEFDPPVLHPVGRAPGALALLSRGLRFDVFVANRDSADVSVLRQGDDGTFTDAGRLPTAEGPADLALQDLDADGLPDLCIAARGEVQVRRNAGDGAFDAPLRWLAGAENRSLAAGDADGDGLPDLAVATGVDVAVLRGR